MIELFNAITVIVLSFLGLVTVALLITFLFLAYRYDITFSIHTKPPDKLKDKDAA
jgi:hypothetical protein